MKTEKVVRVAPNHIDAGIKKYSGIIDAHLVSLLKSAGLNYTPYQFADGRILLVLPNNLGGLLYASREVAYNTLEFAKYK
jgi:hypothetical protein